MQDDNILREIARIGRTPVFLVTETERFLGSPVLIGPETVGEENKTPEARAHRTFQKLESCLPEGRRVKIYLTYSEWAALLEVSESQAPECVRLLQEFKHINFIDKVGNTPAYEVSSRRTCSGPYSIIDPSFLGKNVPRVKSARFVARLERVQKRAAFIAKFNEKFGFDLPTDSPSVRIRAQNVLSVLDLIVATEEEFFDYVVSRTDLSRDGRLYPTICSDLFLHGDFAHDRTVEIKRYRERRHELICTMNQHFGFNFPTNKPAITTRADNVLVALDSIDATTDDFFEYINTRKDVLESGYVFALVCSDIFLYQDFTRHFTSRSSRKESSHFTDFITNVGVHLDVIQQPKQIGHLITQWGTLLGKRFDSEISPEEWTILQNGSLRFTTKFLSFLEENFKQDLPSNWKETISHLVEEVY